MHNALKCGTQSPQRVIKCATLAASTTNNEHQSTTNHAALFMERLRSKLAVVTGAGSGIGAAIVKELLAADLIVVGLARRIERVDALRLSLATAEQQQRLHGIKCDVGNADEVADAFATIAANYGAVKVLINNAGCLRSGQLCLMPGAELQEQLQTNVMGVVNCTRHAFAAMQAAAAKDGAGEGAGESDGHVVLINSILGHSVPALPCQMPALNIYPATKFALTAINEIYRQEFRALGTRVKVTSISPGLVHTELISDELKRISVGKILQPEDVARAVMFVLATPPHVQIYELIMKPMGDVI